MHRLWCLVVIGALAAVVSVVGAGPALAAKGGNNDTAKICQKHGWKMLSPNAGGTFANQGDCVNDGAQGNPPFGTAGQAACDQLHGLFVFLTGPLWTCHYLVPPNPERPPGLPIACATDGPEQGGFFTVPADQPHVWIGTCARTVFTIDPSPYGRPDCRVVDPPHLCWGRLIGTGLAVGANWKVELEHGTVIDSGNADDAGNVNVPLSLPCMPGFLAAHAESVSAATNTVTADANAPLGCS